MPQYYPGRTKPWRARGHKRSPRLSVHLGYFASREEALDAEVAWRSRFNPRHVPATEALGAQLIGTENVELLRKHGIYLRRH